VLVVVLHFTEIKQLVNATKSEQQQLDRIASHLRNIGWLIYSLFITLFKPTNNALVNIKMPAKFGSRNKQNKVS